MENTTLFQGSAEIRNEGFAEIEVGIVKRGIWQIFSKTPLRFLRFGFNMPGDPLFFGLCREAVESVSLLMVKSDNDPEILLFGFKSYDYSDGRFLLEPCAEGFQVTALANYDHFRLVPGESVGTDELTVLKGSDYNALLQQWAAMMAARYGSRVPREIPTGWNDWQYYRNNKTAKDILESCDALKVLKSQGWPLQFVQIDGGYALHLSEWRVPKPEFGMEIGAVSAYIRNAGFRFGLWFAPYIQNVRTAVAKEHPEWLLRDEKGEIVRLGVSNVGESVLIDYTVPGTLEWLREQIVFLVRTWHVEWIKLDGPNITTYRKGVLRDPHCTFQQMLRRSLQVIREAAGEVLVEGEGSMTAAVGLTDLHRVQTDNNMEWFRGNDRNILYAPRVYGKELVMSFLHRIWWCNHRENIILRDYPSPFAHATEENPAQVEQLFTENERKVQLAAAMIAPGGLLLTDPMKELIRRPELLEKAKMLFPPSDGRTKVLDPFPEDGSPYPHWYFLDTGIKCYLAVFNWGETTGDFAVPEEFAGKNLRSLFSGKTFGNIQNITLGARSAEIAELI